MIEFIEGNIVELNPAYVILQTNGMCYRLNISLHCHEQLQGKKNARLFTQMIVKEDAFELYGFADMREKELFMLLRTVSKIGPNLSRVILSSLQPAELVQAIINNNTSLISSIKGIGPKTAQRIVVELRDNIEKHFSASTAESFSPSGDANARLEAVNALVTLGFNKASVENTVNKLITASEGHVSTEELVKEALKKL